jgi:hypothetical protein
MTGNGQRYQVEGIVEGGEALGMIYNEGRGVYFEAQISGTQRQLALIEPGPNNEPDYSRSQQLVLIRQNAAGAPNPPAKRPPAGEPQMGGQQRQSAGNSGLVGRWSCQTGDGPAQLEFVSESQLVFNGERSQYSLVQGVVRVAGEWGPIDYRYDLSGDNLSVTDPYGSAMQCTRQAQTRQGAGAGPNARQGGGTGLESLLQGEKCAYTSSPDGGSSTTRRLYFDGNGRFVYATLSEVEVPEVIGYGQNQGDPGSYRVLGSNRGDEVHLSFDNGSQVVMYVHHVYQGTIMELWYNDLVYAPSLCPGGSS